MAPHHPDPGEEVQGEDIDALVEQVAEIVHLVGRQDHPEAPPFPVRLVEPGIVRGPEPPDRQVPQVVGRLPGKGMALEVEEHRRARDDDVREEELLLPLRGAHPEEAGGDMARLDQGEGPGPWVEVVGDLDALPCEGLGDDARSQARTRQLGREVGRPLPRRRFEGAPAPGSTPWTGGPGSQKTPSAAVP